MAARFPLLLEKGAQLGKLALQNRLVMSPMTRSRALPNGEFDGSGAVEQYYGERAASAGLVTTEGTQPSYQGQGYCRTPGLHTAGQVASWKKVVDRVHANGAKIFLQLMHAGRIAHPLNQFGLGEQGDIVGPSAVQASAKVWVDALNATARVSVPRELSHKEIGRVIEDYAHATRLAIFEAGFDGVELHCASGYLPQQFLSDNANLRTDIYGTRKETFIVEALTAMIAAAGADSSRVGVKVSPAMGFNDIKEADPVATYTPLVDELQRLKVAYIHQVINTKAGFLPLFRQRFHGPLIVGGGLKPEDAETVLREKKADFVAFGLLFLANPDLVPRLRLPTPVFNAPIPATFYSPGPAGLIDYPYLSA